MGEPSNIDQATVAANTALAKVQEAEQAIVELVTANREEWLQDERAQIEAGYGELGEAAEAYLTARARLDERFAVERFLRTFPEHGYNVGSRQTPLLPGHGSARLGGQAFGKWLLEDAEPPPPRRSAGRDGQPRARCTCVSVSPKPSLTRLMRTAVARSRGQAEPAVPVRQTTSLGTVLSRAHQKSKGA